MTTSKLIGELAALCAELNADDYHVFFDISGHVGWVNVRVSEGGWNKDIDSTDIGRYYFEGVENPEIHVRRLIEDLQRHHDNYRKEQNK